MAETSALERAIIPKDKSAVMLSMAEFLIFLFIKNIF